MNKKNLILVMAVFFITNGTLYADTTINGYSFDDKSAQITNEWFSIDENTKWTFEIVSGPSEEDATGTTTGITTETVYGVKCLKVRSLSDEEVFWWYAQDTAGNVHTFKKIEDDGDVYVVTSDEEIPNIYMSANPQEGDIWQYSRWEGHNLFTKEVVSTSYDFGDFSNCLKIKVTTPNKIYYSYYKSSVGQVGGESADGTVYQRVSDSDTGDDSEDEDTDDSEDDSSDDSDGSDSGGGGSSGGCFVDTLKPGK